MLNAINNLSVLEFVVFVFAAMLSIIQLAGLAIHALRGSGTTLVYGWVAAILWIVLFAMTR